MHDSDVLRNWADMRLFLAILDHGSLVAASEHLGLTQPTVGRRLAGLEERFGTALFVRSGRRMQLTDAGSAILESARRMEREMYAIERNIAAQSRGLIGEVTLSASEGTGSEWLPPVLARFHQRYPEITLNVQIENRMVDLIHREADIALRLGQPRQPDLIARRLVTVGFGLYAAQSYLKQSPAIRSVGDLAGHRMVRMALPHHPFDPLGELLLEHGLEGRFVFISNSPTTQMSAVREGFGIGVLSHRWAGRMPGLVRVLPELTVNEVDLWLVTHEDFRHSARIRAVADFVADAARADAGSFARGTHLA